MSGSDQGAIPFWHAWRCHLLLINPYPFLHLSPSIVVYRRSQSIAIRARHTGPFVGIPASGADVIMRSIDIWRFDNDRFVEHWVELNLLEVFQQMGAIPLQPGAMR